MLFKVGICIARVNCPIFPHVEECVENMAKGLIWNFTRLEITAINAPMLGYVSRRYLLLPAEIYQFVKYAAFTNAVISSFLARLFSVLVKASEPALSWKSDAMARKNTWYKPIQCMIFSVY